MPPWRCSMPGATGCRCSCSAPRGRSMRPTGGRGSTGFTRPRPRAPGPVVLTDAKTGAGFPSRHKLHGPPAGNNPSDAACALIREADAILSLDWVDLAGVFKAACGEQPVAAKVVLASLDHLIHNG